MTVKPVKKSMKPRHWLRWFSAAVGVVLIAVGLWDARADILPYLDAVWLIGAGAVLVGLGARKPPKSVRVN